MATEDNQDPELPGRERGATPGNEAATVQPSGLTLDAFAAAKALPVAHLEASGWSETKYLSAPAVRIPYRDEHGGELAVRFRIALTGDGFRWRKGAKLCLYGLHRLAGVRAAGQVLIVEGESDAVTAWHYGLPCVGVPGASNWKDDRDAQHFDGIDMYVIDEEDRGGDTLLDSLRASRLRGRVHVVRLPDGLKDLSALHLDDPDHFRERLRAAVEAAEPLTAILTREAEARKAELWIEVQALAAAPDILDRFLTMILGLGVVGEHQAVKIIYLAVVSRLLDRPVSVVVKGASSAGKSYLVEGVLCFFPDDAYYALSGMSERALAYGDEPLAHRMLVIYEAAGLSGDFASYLMRSLLSEGRIRYETVEKTPDGMRARLIEREGPTGLILTTTAITLHPENETRMLSIPVTDTPAQTAAVLHALAAPSTAPPDLREWQALAEWLALTNATVDIPFAAALAAAIPPVAVRLRRDFRTILTLIRAHALLHQVTRQRDAQGRIVATLADYAAVRALVADLLADGIGATVSPTVRETVAAVADLTPDGHDTTNAAVARKLKLDKSAGQRRVRAAIHAGYVHNQEDRKFRPARLVLGDPLPEDVDVLPSPERLQGCIDAQGDSTPLPPACAIPDCASEVEYRLADGSDVCGRHNLRLVRSATDSGLRVIGTERGGRIVLRTSG